MPAVKVDDLSALPRIDPVDDKQMTDRRTVAVVDAPTMLEGAGFEVRRAFSGVDLQLVDPFLLLDHLGPWSTPRARPGAPRTIHTAGSRLSPTSWTGSSSTSILTAAAD